MIFSYSDESGDDGFPGSSPLFILSTGYLNSKIWREKLKEIKEFRKKFN